MSDEDVKLLEAVRDWRPPEKLHPLAMFAWQQYEEHGNGLPDEALALLTSRRQADQIEGETAQQQARVLALQRPQVTAPAVRCEEGVDRMHGDGPGVACLERQRGNRSSLRRAECPVGARVALRRTG